jgi:site-specific recombinase XerD
MHVAQMEIDPVIAVREYRKRTESLEGSSKTFFFAETGQPIQSSGRLSADYLAPYIYQAGVPKNQTPYSIKTAVITALFDRGFSKEQVSSFTGHANSANAALRHFHDPSNKWLGHQHVVV